MKQRIRLLFVACLVAGVLLSATAGCGNSPERKAVIAAGEAAAVAWQRAHNFAIKERKADTGAVKADNAGVWIEIEMRTKQAANSIVWAARAKPLSTGDSNSIDGNQKAFTDTYNEVTNCIAKIRELMDCASISAEARKAIVELRTMVDEAERLSLVVGQTTPAGQP